MHVSAESLVLICPPENCADEMEDCANIMGKLR